MATIECDECNFSDQYCYDCQYRYCLHEDCKYQKFINRTRGKLDDELYWIDIDWEEQDEVANAAFRRYITWLSDQGFENKRMPSYKTYMVYRSDGIPVTDCGYHLGALYFHKISERRLAYE